MAGEAVERAAGRVAQRLHRAVRDGRDGPVWAGSEDARWRRSSRPHWAAAFALGALWLTAPTRAAEVVAGLDPTPASRVDGFTAFCDWFTFGAGAGHRDMGEPTIDAARAVAARCDPVSGLLVVEEASPPRWLEAPGAAVAFVDPLGPVVSLLCTAAQLAEEPAWAELAATQVRTMLGALRRDDGSYAQVVAFDRATGRPLDTRTGEQGFAPGSTWSRSAAWALLGAATAAARLPGEDLQWLADRAADWWQARASERGTWVPPWDFDAPGSGQPVDTSAAAIAAAALARMPGRHEAAGAAMAELSGWVTDDGRLLGGCYHLPHALAVADELVWGSYYFLEAATILAGRRRPATL